MPTPRIAAFGYHEISDRPWTTGFQRPGALPYTLTLTAWARHLHALAAAPAVPELVTAIDLAAPGDHLLLTFDDGGKSALPTAEALAARGWKAHFFVVTGLLDTPTFLDVHSVRALRALGHEVGSHSATHPDIFRELPFDRMLEEWRVSRDRLAQILGEPCATASVPGGDVSSEVFRSADAVGVRYLFTSEPWTAPRREGACWVLGRFVVKNGTPPARIGELARFQGWHQALLVRRLKNAARTAAPGLYRALVERRARPKPRRQRQP